MEGETNFTFRHRMKNRTAWSRPMVGQLFMISQKILAQYSSILVNSRVYDSNNFNSDHMMVGTTFGMTRIFHARSNPKKRIYSDPNPKNT